MPISSYFMSRLEEARIIPFEADRQKFLIEADSLVHSPWEGSGSRRLSPLPQSISCCIPHEIKISCTGYRLSFNVEPNMMSLT
jgi:hypothetical protein